ncbi:uncharacterized protein FTOL_13779 [Fusarium torulosum]|uniref:Uncharacterized protein n=1 Tax=Fusarium torulosum TaxID=33205 RepID=A0AAE8MMU0_9HYPO|nr:uncharacterized protein FTOL_13779 [Fusarium torulosum]
MSSSISSISKDFRKSVEPEFSIHRIDRNALSLQNLCIAGSARAPSSSKVGIIGPLLPFRTTMTLTKHVKPSRMAAWNASKFEGHRPLEAPRWTISIAVGS